MEAIKYVDIKTIALVAYCESVWWERGVVGFCPVGIFWVLSRRYIWSPV